MRSLFVAIFLAAASLTASARVYTILDVGTRNGEPVYSLNGAERTWEEQMKGFRAIVTSDPSDSIYLRPAPETKMETIFKVLRALKEAGLRKLKLPAYDSLEQKSEYTVDMWLDVELQE